MSDSTGRVFAAPVIRDYGTLVELTEAQTDGAVTDAAFPAGTPRGEITFS